MESCYHFYRYSLSNKVKNTKDGHLKYACTLRAASNKSPLPHFEGGFDSAAFKKIQSYDKAKPSKLIVL